MIELIAKILKAKKNPRLNGATLKVPDEDFLPYVCHFDSNTILTKNGELMQIIRVTGFGANSLSSEIIPLREAVRDAISDHVKENNIALWFNTIRRKKDIAPTGEFPDFFSQELNNKWVKFNNWNNQYVNELYITIIIEGFDTSVANFGAFARSLSYHATQHLHHEFLKQAHQKLSSISSKVISRIENFGAKLLGIKEWDGILYSEPMRFFGKIVNLYEERYPLAANDISSEMASHKVAFGNKEIEVIGEDNKNFAAILSLKEYQEISLESLDHVLQLPFEFIITQSFDFHYNHKDLEHFQYQNYILQVSGDEELRQELAIEDFTKEDDVSQTSFGKLQTTLTVIADNQKSLEQDINMIIEKFIELGLVVIREDVFLEHCFWSQLPGNFKYLRRQKLIPTTYIAGFSALHSFPSGKFAGNKWGSAITALRSIVNTPYFFNFHDGDLGHTAIIGPKSSGKTTLTNFLLTQSLKFKTKIFILEMDDLSQTLVNVLGGKYYKIDSENSAKDDKILSKKFEVNPVIAAKNFNNPEIVFDLVNSFLQTRVARTKSSELENEVKNLGDFNEKIRSLNNFNEVIEIFNTPSTKNTYKELNNTEFKKVFCQENQSDFNNSVTGINFSAVKNNKFILSSLVNYVIDLIASSLDGNPAIIVIKDAWKLIDETVFETNTAEFLQFLKDKNAVVLFSEDDSQKILQNPASEIIKENLATTIFMPNKEIDESYSKIFKLENDSLKVISMMDINQNHFLVKNSTDSVILQLNLNKLGEELSILSGNEISKIALVELLKNLPEEEKNNHQNLVQKLCEVLREIEQQLIEEERQALIRENQLKRKRLKEKLEED